MSRGGICAKGMAGIQALYHPNRNKYPMRRVGARGGNDWERISWDEAITEVATKINEFSDKYGSECITVSTVAAATRISPTSRASPRPSTRRTRGSRAARNATLPRQGMAQFVYGSGPDLSFADNNGRDYYFNDSEVTCNRHVGNRPLQFRRLPRAGAPLPNCATASRG